jgi:hypothetical protein
MTRIFIENNELDLTQGLSNQLTYAIDDLQNLDSKSTAFSKTIILPGTTRNNALLGNVFEFTNANFTNDSAANVNYNFNASRSAVCRIEVDGLQIIKGVFRLLEIIRDGRNIEYECAVFGELGGFVAALGNSRLEDLDFSAYNHNYTYANITGSWTFTAGQGYVYPLIDYGNYSTAKKNWQYKTFRPALFVREYINKIITNAGYTWESTFFDTAFFKRIIVPCNQKVLSKVSSTSFDVSFSGTQAYGGDPTTGPFYERLPQPTQPTLGSFTTSDNKTFTYTGAATLTGTLTVRIIGTFANDIANNLTVYAYAGSGAAFYDFPQDDGFGSDDPFDVTLTLNVTLNNGDLFFIVASRFDDASNFQLTITSISSKIAGIGTQPVPINLGEAVIINDTIPRGIFQKDFFTSILKMFNLLVTEDKFKEKHLVIEPYVDFYTGERIDWSNKIDRSKPIRLKSMSEANARYYELKWKQDNDFYNEDYRKKYNEGYGDRIFDNGLDFAKDKETVDVIFAPSPLYGTTGEDKIFPAIYKKSDNNTKEDQIEHVIRIMQVKKITGVASWDILNGVSVLGSNTDYLYAGHFDDPDAPNADLNFGATKELYFELVSGNLSNNLFNAYYSPYLSEITDKDSRLLTAQFKLTDLDIFNLDFAKFIYIDGALYRLSKVVDYTPASNDTTKVELLRVINTVY